MCLEYLKKKKIKCEANIEQTNFTESNFTETNFTESNINDFKNKKIRCYFLVYKLKNSNILWVVKLSDDYYDLKNKLDYFVSSVEQYYIFERYCYPHIIDEKFKQFKIFFKSSKDILIYSTKIL